MKWSVYFSFIFPSTYFEWCKIPSILMMIKMIRSISESIVKFVRMPTDWTAEIGRRKLSISIISAAHKLISSKVLIAIVPISIVWTILEIVSEIFRSILVSSCIECQKVRTSLWFLWARIHVHTKFVCFCLIAFTNRTNDTRNIHILVCRCHISIFTHSGAINSN